MLIAPSNKRDLLNFLINRWKYISGLAAIERVYIASCNHAKENNLPKPEEPIFINTHPCLQITIIKQYIVDILPEAKFIQYDYRAPFPLDPSDFVELYLAEQTQCIDKVTALMEKLRIS